MKPTYGAAIIKRKLLENADSTAGERVLAKVGRDDVLREAYERGYHVARMVQSEGWKTVEAVIYKHMKLDDMTKLARSDNREALANATYRYAILQSLLDDVYTLVATSNRAKEALSSADAGSRGERHGKSKR